ncbi:MAG: pilus assembly protein PilM [Deltaproteobacteria bacterium]|nr:pilus assembly protein PilM [Deltaproteobacteria bacterium]
MPQRILGVDIGSWSVKGVLVETAFRTFNVVAAKEIPLPPETEDSTLTSRRIEALRAVTEDLRADVVVAGYPGDAAVMRFVSLPYADARRIDQTIAGELEDLLPYELDDAVFSHELLTKDAEGSLSLCAAAQSDRVKETLETFQAAGLDPRFLPIDVVELFNLYTHLLHDDASRPEAPPSPSEEAETFIVAAPDAPPDARLIVDIGHERTLVSAAGEGGPSLLRVLRAGGHDVTRAIAVAYEISMADAEAGKHEDAFVASSRHPAATDAAQAMSDVIARGLLPLIRELRRSLQAIRKERRVRIARIDLLGGGARIRNLPNYLAEELNVPVAYGVAVEQLLEQHVTAPRRGAYSCALAYALRIAGDERVARVNFRTGEFAYAGQLQSMRERLPFIGAAAAALMILLGAHAFVQYQLSSHREAAIDKEFCAITKDVVGREICEPAIALSVIKQPASALGNFKLPEKSGVAVAAELSHRIPSKLDLTIDEMDISTERARISGVTKSFDAVDEIVGSYAESPCFSDIKKGRLRKTADGTAVEFQLSMRLGCAK